MSNFKKTDLSAVLAQASNAKPRVEGSKFQKDELMKKYFNPRVDKRTGKTSEIFKARIVPNEDGSSPFSVVKFHYMQVNGKWEKLLCLDEVGQDCPLCDAYQGLSADGNKEEAKKYRTSEFFIVRVIERGKEAEGIKFWRFKKNFKGQGEFDKLTSLIQMGVEIFDPLVGNDLSISCGLDDRGNSVVNAIITIGQTSRLAETDSDINKIINDDTTWKDVYRPKTKEHLEDVVAGRAQYWNQELKRYVRPGEENETAEKAILSDNHINFEDKIEKDILKEETTEKVVKTTKASKEVVKDKVEEIDVNKTILAEDDDDDLPF